jgi:hypothetical protein
VVSLNVLSALSGCSEVALMLGGTRVMTKDLRLSADAWSKGWCVGFVRAEVIENCHDSDLRVQGARRNQMLVSGFPWPRQ